MAGTFFVHDFDSWDEMAIGYLLGTVMVLAVYLANVPFQKQQRITFECLKVTVERMGLFGRRA